MREIVIDTETTGLDPLGGHRVVEIGAVELVDHAPTGRTFHRYLNPERDMPADAVAVHGLTAEFLADKPLFNHVADDFLAFVGDAPLVAHNAARQLVELAPVVGPNHDVARLDDRVYNHALCQPQLVHGVIGYRGDKLTPVHVYTNVRGSQTLRYLNDGSPEFIFAKQHCARPSSKLAP